MVPVPSAYVSETYSFALFIPRLFFALDAAENSALSTGSHARYGMNSSMMRHSSYDLPRITSRTRRTLYGDMCTPRR